MKLGLAQWIAQKITGKIFASGVRSWNIAKGLLDKLKVSAPLARLSSFWNQAEQVQRSIDTNVHRMLRPNEPFGEYIDKEIKRNIPYKVLFDVRRFNPITGKYEKGTASRYFMSKPNPKEAIAEIEDWFKEHMQSERGMVVEITGTHLVRNTRLI